MNLNTVHFNVRVFESPDEVAHAATERFVAFAKEAIAERGLFSVALAGGNTPRRAYELLASDTFKNLIEWSRVHLFWGDERSVPPDHPDSNYAMVYTALISKVDIPPSNVHRVAAEADPVESAAAYDRELRSFFGDVAPPRFDLVLLGMGEDGHTASLFPNSEGLTEKSKWVVATKARGGQDRISLTLPAINNGAHVLFLVTGSGKAQRLAGVIRNGPEADQLPAQLISPVNGTLEWLVDQSAASLLGTHLSSSHSREAKKR